MKNDIVVIGVVEDIKDPKKRGRIRVRVEHMHGRKNDKNAIPTGFLKWADPEDKSFEFKYPKVGKVVYIKYLDGDYNKPVWIGSEHYNINLQNKLDSLSDSSYKEFFAVYFDDAHQYYHDPVDGIMFDYNKTNINIKPNGDMNLNLRDNNAKLKLGSPDANQQAILGNHFMTWMDELTTILLSGAYIGNLTAPTLPTPLLIQCINKFKAIKATFLSDHVYIVDDKSVKEQKRKYDEKQDADNQNDENLNGVNNVKTKGYQPEERPKIGGSPETVPPNTFSDQLSSTLKSSSGTDNEKFEKPFGDSLENGNIPLDGMTVSVWASKSFDDERQYLLDAAATSLDSFLDMYNTEKESEWSDIIVTKGYQDSERQANTHALYKTTSPKAGEDPFGYGNQVELYFGLESKDIDNVNEVKLYLKTGQVSENKYVKMLDYLIIKGKEFNWKLAGKTSNDDYQYWHWLYKE